MNKFSVAAILVVTAAACRAMPVSDLASPTPVISTAAASIQLTVSSRIGGDQRLDIAAQVLTIDHKPVKGAGVVFAVTNGTVEQTNVNTDDTGWARTIASANWQNTITATAAGLADSAKITGVAATAPSPLSVTISNPGTIYEDEETQLGVNLSSAPGSTARVVAWTFGDGARSTANDFSPRHTYGADGKYTVTLDVADDLGRTAHAERQVTVQPAVVASTPTPTPGLVLTVTCTKNTPRNFTCVLAATYQGRDISSRVVKAEWAWGEGPDTVTFGTPATLTASHTYSGVGKATVLGSVQLDTGETIGGSASITAG